MATDKSVFRWDGSRDLVCHPAGCVITNTNYRLTRRGFGQTGCIVGDGMMHEFDKLLLKPLRPRNGGEP